MTTKYFLFGLLAATILLWSCSVTSDFLEQDPEVQKVVQGAEKQTTDMNELLVAANATDGNLIVNGDFETPLVGTGYRSGATDWDSFTPDSSGTVEGWTVEITGDDGGPTGPDLEFWNLSMGPSYSGNQYVELDGFDPTKISQVVSTIPGVRYDLTYAWRPRIGPTDRMKVWISGAEVGDHSGFAGSWTAETYSFTASSSSTTVAFAEVGPDDQLGMLLDAVSLCLFPPIPVGIDIKPGSDPNCFNNDGNGVIPVAILGSETFDVIQIDPTTVSLEGMAIKVVGKSDKLLAHIEDVNGDGFDDLVVQIQDQDGVFAQGEGVATVTGFLPLDGMYFEGSDSICVTQ
jgi:hypothetical protein